LRLFFTEKKQSELYDGLERSEEEEWNRMVLSSFIIKQKRKGLLVWMGKEKAFPSSRIIKHKLRICGEFWVFSL